jgi:hypothetical protein
MFFRGIYFPQMNKRAWLKLVFQNRGPMLSLSREAVGMWRASRKKKTVVDGEPVPVMNEHKAKAA